MLSDFIPKMPKRIYGNPYARYVGFHTRIEYSSVYVERS